MSSPSGPFSRTRMDSMDISDAQQLGSVHPSLDEILQDFTPGPLSPYRENATFDWKKMKLFLDGKPGTLFKVHVFNT